MRTYAYAATCSSWIAPSQCQAAASVTAPGPLRLDRLPVAGRMAPSRSRPSPASKSRTTRPRSTRRPRPASLGFVRLVDGHTATKVLFPFRGRCPPPEAGNGTRRFIFRTHTDPPLMRGHKLPQQRVLCALRHPKPRSAAQHTRPFTFPLSRRQRAETIAGSAPRSGFLQTAGAVPIYLNWCRMSVSE